MNATKETKIIVPEQHIPAVTQDIITLTLTLEEARVLREIGEWPRQILQTIRNCNTQHFGNVLEEDIPDATITKTLETLHQELFNIGAPHAYK